MRTLVYASIPQMISAISIRLLFPILILGLSHLEILAEQPKPSKLQYSVSNRIKQPFLADEKSIRKLREIIEKRGTEKCPNPKLSYQARFSDNTFYETEDLESILSEMNRDPQTIVYISMKLDSFECLSHHGGPRVELEFSLRTFDEGVSYSISGNRDWVLLTQGDLTKHIESVLTNYVLPLWALKGLVSVPIACIVTWTIGLLLYLNYREDWIKKNPALQQHTLGRYLVHDKYLIYTLVIIGYATLMASLMFSDKFINHLWPPGTFLIGDEIRRYEELTKTRNGVLTFIGGTIFLPIFYKFLRRSLRRVGVRLP